MPYRAHAFDPQSSGEGRVSPHFTEKQTQSQKAKARQESSWALNPGPVTASQRSRPSPAPPWPQLLLFLPVTGSLTHLPCGLADGPPRRCPHGTAFLWGHWVGAFVQHWQGSSGPSPGRRHATRVGYTDGQQGPSRAAEVPASVPITAPPHGPPGGRAQALSPLGAAVPPRPVHAPRGDGAPAAAPVACKHGCFLRDVSLDTRTEAHTLCVHRAGKFSRQTGHSRARSGPPSGSSAGGASVASRPPRHPAAARALLARLTPPESAGTPRAPGRPGARPGVAGQEEPEEVRLVFPAGGTQALHRPHPDPGGRTRVAMATRRPQRRLQAGVRVR